MNVLRKEKEDTRELPWVEKYRPKNLGEVAAQEHAVKVLKKSLETANLPHMLFYGPPGTGKTSTILALTKELYGPELCKSRVLELNASDERGISIIRDKVKQFARLTVSNPTKHDLEHYPCPPYKIIILDEADSMTADAQSALRRTMETYSGVTRFCLICNYITRIIDPLASRCSKFRFRALDNGNSMGRLELIAAKEGLKVDQDVLLAILKIANGDLRKAITFLQSSSKLFNLSNEHITVANINEISGSIPAQVLADLVSCAKSKNFNNIQQTVSEVVANGWSCLEILNQLHDELLIANLEFSNAQKNSFAKMLFETDKRLSNGADEHLQLLSLLTQMSLVV